jgi:hypothetical protein
VTQGLRDILLLVGAVVAAVIVGALLRRFIEPRWEFMLGFAAVFAACAGVKVRWPTHTIMSAASWPYLILVFVLVEAVALLLADWTIVGVWWTIPAIVCLGLLYCVVHIAFGPRRG